jgi:hypothetical protein
MDADRTPLNLQRLLAAVACFAIAAQLISSNIRFMNSDLGSHGQEERALFRFGAWIGLSLGAGIGLIFHRVFRLSFLEWSIVGFLIGAFMTLLMRG